MIEPLVISEVIAYLTELLNKHGDLPVYYYNDGTWAVTRSDIHYEEANPDGWEEYSKEERIEIS